MKRPCDACEVENKASIEVAKADKNLNVAVGLWRMITPFFDCLYTGRVHSKALFIDEKSEIFELGLEEVAFLWIGV
jgi:hypothetical protein